MVDLAETGWRGSPVSIGNLRDAVAGMLRNSPGRDKPSLDDAGLFNNAALDEEGAARLHGMLGDLARQLGHELVAARGEPVPADPAATDPDIAELAAALARVPGLSGHLLGLAIEWQASLRLHDRLGIDPGLPPLVQAWIDAADPLVAADAMKLVEAQARFCRQQPQMRTLLGELPADLLYGALTALGNFAGATGVVAGSPAHAAAAVAAIRSRYDEGATRLGVTGRLLAAQASHALAALALGHAGVANFVMALSLIGGLDRETCLLALTPGQEMRLALMLRATGVKLATVQETLLALNAIDDGLSQELAEAIARMDPGHAAQILGAAGRENFSPGLAQSGNCTSPPAQALTDGDDRLLSADDALASLQLRCGGTIPGAIAVPALAELVRKARRLGLRIARPFAAQDAQDAIRGWAEIDPLGGASGKGCLITLHHWHAAPLPPEDPAVTGRRRAAIDRALADLVARLDARQCLLSVVGEAPDLAELLAAMQRGVGRAWTEFVTVRGDATDRAGAGQLPDGAPIEIAGSARPWRARLVRQAGPGGELAGFLLYIIADMPLPEHGASPALVGAIGERVIARGLAPVLRQPIARIIANAETIRMRMAGPLEEQYAGFASDIVTAGEHLLALVDDLADLEVIEADDFSTVVEPIDLADVARRAAAILGGRARNRQIALIVPPDDASLPARGDLRRTLQVLLNLIGNALQYAPEQTRITIEVADLAGRAQVTVADQGAGLSPDQHSRLFEKFERLGRGEGGSGLGLFISRRLARAMGGDLTAAGTPGEGARFTLSLPGG